MKKTLLSVIASGLFLMASGQNSTPPKEVQAAFAEKFHTVQELIWKQEGSEWEAEFKMQGTEMSASFDISGKWLETESEVKKEDVPAQVFKSIALKFEGFEIDEIERVESAEFTGFEIELEKEETEAEILCTAEGEITIKKVKVEDEDND